MKFLVSLLGLGISGGGIFIGTLQQNLSNIKTEVDKLFEEIEQDIRDFSEENPMTEDDAKKIKDPKTLSINMQSRKRRNTVNVEKPGSKNTLGVWTDIWISMLDEYVDSLWKSSSDGGSQNENLESRVFSKKDKEAALKAAEKNVENEKQRFENRLNNAKEEIENIYKKMKNFLQIMKLPKKYNNSTNHNTPYEEYVKKILTE